MKIQFTPKWGPGLGLSIVRGILEKHGSKVQMASELEVGTIFWFDLPLEQADARTSCNSSRNDAALATPLQEVVEL